MSLNQIQSDSEHTLQVETLTYEQSFKLLEEIIADLESGEKPLQESLALFEKGQALVKRCSELLDQAELKIKLLSGDTLSDFKPDLSE